MPRFRRRVCTLRVPGSADALQPGVILRDGAIRLRHFEDAAIARPDLKNTVAKVSARGVESGASLSQACELTVTLNDGSTRSVERGDADGRGADDYPRYMAAKFTDCVEQVFDRAYAEDLLAKLVTFDRCTNVGEVIAMLRAHEQADKVDAVQS